MSTRSLALRFLGLLTLSIWVGGFTFYSAVVIPILHDAIGTSETGAITRRVTHAINAAGVATVAVWWLIVGLERSLASGSLRLRRARFWLLAGTSALLVFLVVLHRVMDDRLDAGRLQGFYPLHRVYLIASTAQWFLNLGLLLVPLLEGKTSPQRHKEHEGSTKGNMKS
jgi:hypothetical protein